jgi:hypothetical protein
MGQNFLQDDDLARWMADSLQAGPEDTIIEIGPGLGAVTKHLIGRSRRLILVEKDARLAAPYAKTAGSILPLKSSKPMPSPSTYGRFSNTDRSRYWETYRTQSAPPSWPNG